ncbi:pyridoxal 5'-phosphate synthase glutaminase subunit PdxT [Chryseomicrobium palamuruense]|uniref:Pyridoxal 5'-phosphate synthase subunit PdxT n=1 Tax=Chryseomicrobium palamuruense TaxID=682973 RepID=A0ABV8UUL9_9BACL
MKIGVLALQGAVREHVTSIEKSGAQAVPVKRIEDLEGLDALVLPGGESTTMRKLLDRYELLEPIRKLAEEDVPMFGTCAGLILLARTISGQDSHLNVMDVTVERNSFGRQVDSFEANLAVRGLDEPFRAVFIRAPHIVKVGASVDVLAEHNGRIVLARDGNFLGCSFHPELTDDNRLMEYFIGLVEKSNVQSV